MSIATARIFAAIMGGLAASFLSRFAQMAMEAYPRAFNRDAIRTKCAVGFMLGVGRVLWLVYWGQWCWVCGLTALILGPILGGVLLTAAHFVGEIIWEAISDLWSVVRSFFTSYLETSNVAN